MTSMTTTASPAPLLELARTHIAGLAEVEAALDDVERPTDERGAR